VRGKFICRSIVDDCEVKRQNYDIPPFFEVLTHLLTHHIAAFYDFLRSKRNGERVVLDNANSMRYTFLEAEPTYVLDVHLGGLL